jgi:hypothetical protein
MLAALATPSMKRSPGWSDMPDGRDDDLDDDIATLSYESALRTHARRRPADLGDYSFSQVDGSDPGSKPSPGSLPATAAKSGQTASPKSTDFPRTDTPPTTQDLTADSDHNLKSASITIRLSKAESAQLHQRATEAGLTVSAYMRSCTFEAESLRALVKDTLAQLRSDPPNGNQSKDIQAASAPVRRSWFQWRSFFRPRVRASQPIARA